MLAPVLIAVALLAVPAAAQATTVSVEPYVEPPNTDPFGSCSRYMMCPPDMVVVTAGPNENNAVVVTAEGSAPADGGSRLRYSFIVRDRIAQVQAGPGCAQLDVSTVSCSAGAVGSVRLGDGDDWFASANGATEVHGGAGQDVLQDLSGWMTGGPGDDVIVARDGTGGGGDDVLMVTSGAGGAGDDILRCFPRVSPCTLHGGPGDDLVTGGTGVDRIDCGRGRRDRAVANRRDAVKRSCERLTRPR
jgi:Ca2+-binding RTX toxin-like protein